MRWLAARGGPLAVGETVLIRAVGEAKAEELQDGHGGKVVILNLCLVYLQLPYTIPRQY